MLKKCTKCGMEFPATKEYFYKRTKSNDGLDYKYKSCYKEYRDKFYKDNKEKVLERNKKYQDGHKNEIKEYMKRYYKNNEDDIKNNVRHRYNCNKEKVLEYQKEYHANNKDKVSKYQKEYRENNYDKLSKYKKEYRINNKERLKEWLSKYYKTDHYKLLSSIHRQRRRTLKKKIESSLTGNQWFECKNSFDNKCCYCGEINILTQDHFVPLSNGGEHTRNNIVPACKSCNSKKHNKDFFSWYPKQEFYSKKREQKILKYLNYGKETKTQQLALTC